MVVGHRHVATRPDNALLLGQLRSNAPSMRDYDDALDAFLDLRQRSGGGAETFYAEARDRFGFSEETVDWIVTVCESAQFRATFGRLVASHTTDFEDDPWFLAAQRRYRVPKS